MLNKILDELKDTWDYTSEELDDIKEKIVEYASACLMDSKIAKECLLESRGKNKREIIN